MLMKSFFCFENRELSLYYTRISIIARIGAIEVQNRGVIITPGTTVEYDMLLACVHLR